LREWGNAIDPTYAKGIFCAYEAVRHLYQAEEAEKKKNSFKEREELAKAIHCLKESQQSFHFLEYRDHWNEIILHRNLERLYESQNKLKEALLASQRISCIERTRMLFRALPIIDEIAAGREKLASDEIVGYMRQDDEFEFGFEGQALKAELLRGSQLTFLPEYDYVAMLVSGDSMDEAGISPGNYVILRRKSKHVPLSPTSGDIVAVVFRDEDEKATLKYIVIEPNRVILKPKSSKPKHKTRVLRPEVFTGGSPSVEVVGVAIAVLKPQPVAKSQPEPEVQQRRFIDVRFPEICKINQPVHLSIQLTLKPVHGLLPPSEVVVDLTSKEVKGRRGELTVVVSSDSFEIDRRSRELSIPLDKDSERIDFEWVARRSGPHTVEIEFFHGTALVSRVKVSSK
jgi:SOS-response transcriptional repressor LexA